MPKQAKIKTAVETVQCTAENCVHVIKGSQHVGSKPLGVFEVATIAVVAYLSVMLGVIISLGSA